MTQMIEIRERLLRHRDILRLMLRSSPDFNRSDLEIVISEHKTAYGIVFSVEKYSGIVK